MCIRDRREAGHGASERREGLRRPEDGEIAHPGRGMSFIHRDFAPSDCDGMPDAKSAGRFIGR